MENEYDSQGQGQSRGSSRVMPRRPTRYRLSKKVGNVNIIEVNGRMAPSDANDELSKRIDTMIASGERNFLLDLSGVSYISSTGVGSLLQSFHHVERAEGQLKLLTPSQCVSHIIKLSKLDSVFEMFDDENLALKGFEPSPQTPAEKKVRLRKPKEVKE